MQIGQSPTPVRLGDAEPPDRADRRVAFDDQEWGAVTERAIEEIRLENSQGSARSDYGKKTRFQLATLTLYCGSYCL